MKSMKGMNRSMWLVQMELMITAVGMTAATAMFWETPAAAYLNSGEAGQCFSVIADRATDLPKFCESIVAASPKQEATPVTETKPVKPPTQSKSRQNLVLMLRLLNLKQEISRWIS
jgi:hypothetical protein